MLFIFIPTGGSSSSYSDYPVPAAFKSSSIFYYCSSKIFLSAGLKDFYPGALCGLISSFSSFKESSLAYSSCDSSLIGSASSNPYSSMFYI